MKTRLELQTKLEEILGVNHVYYQPPENLKMDYPAIRYERNDIFIRNADNIHYHSLTCYDIIVIDQNPDNEAISKIMELPYSSFDRHYKSDNLNHDVLRLYW